MCFVAPIANGLLAERPLIALSPYRPIALSPYRPIAHRRNAVPYPIANRRNAVPYPIANSVSVARRAFCLSEKAIRKDADGLYMNVIMRILTQKDECYPKRRLDRKTEESITSSARAGTRKRKELSIWLKRPTNVLYLYTLISYQSATFALPLRYKA